MSIFNTVYAFVAVSFLILGMIFFFIDYMLWYSVGFLVLGIFLMMIKGIWGVSVWADNATRKMGED